MNELAVYDTRTLGRYPPRQAQTLTVTSGQQHIIFTRGDDLITPTEYKRSFDLALERAMGNTVRIGDETLAIAYSVATTAYICTEYRASKTASIPLLVTDPNKAQLGDTQLGYFVSKQAPNVLADSVRSLLTFGRLYLRKLRNASGWPTGIEYLNPLTVREVLGEERAVMRYDVTLISGRVDRVPVDDIIYTQMFDPEPYGLGLSKLEAAFKSASVEQSIATYAAAFFVNSAQPDGFLTFDEGLDDDEFNEAKEEWKRSFKGARNAHRTAVMPGGARWTSMQAAPKDLAMVELKSVSREDTCGVYEVDPILVGLKGAADALSANSTYSTAEIAHIRGVTIPFLKTVILPALNNQWVSTDLDRRNYYSLTIDENSIPALADANLVKAETAINLTSSALLDYTESRKMIGFEERASYLQRKPDEPLALWREGGITLGELRRLTGVPGVQPSINDDVVLIGGTLYPAARLAEVAAKNADAAGMASASPFGLAGGLPPVNAPSLPPGSPTAPAAPAPPAPDERGTRSAIFLLAMPNQPDLVGLQQRVKAFVGDMPCEWNNPEDFHVTLVYIPAISDEQVQVLAARLPSVDVPDMALNVGSLKIFDNVGEHAIHFRIRQNADLGDFQETLYSLCAELSIPLSAYSHPDGYIPHVTMGYAQGKPSTATFQSRLMIHPDEFRFIVDDEVIYRRGCQDDKSTRSIEPLTLGVSFADHQFIRYARRALGEALTEQGVNAEWVADTDWRLELCRCDKWTPNAVASLLRSAEFADAPKLDIETGSFIVRDGGVCWSIQGAPLEALRKSVMLDGEAAGLQFADNGECLIRLCKPERDITPEQLPHLSYPLVVNNLTLYRGDEAYQRWELRGVSPARSRELSAWRRAVKNRGADYVFKAEALQQTPAAQFVRDALSLIGDIEDEARESWITDTFTHAERLLTHDLTRAYSGTYTDFVAELVRIIGDAHKSDIDRRNFAARMRAALRQYGLIAFRDGMEEVGYSPESFSPEELAEFRAWQTQQSEYVTGFGAEIFKEGITDGEVRYRAEMWGQVSLYAIWLVGRKMGAPQKRYRWNWNPTAEHCPDCKVLHNQVHTLADWFDKGLIPGRGTDCGPGCRCGLVETDTAERGGYLG